MIHNNIDTEKQADIQIFGKIATSLHQCGVSTLSMGKPCTWGSGWQLLNLLRET
jgi:hypothetical protein